MKTFTKALFALAIIAATPALADDNNTSAQVFDRAATYQATTQSHATNAAAAQTKAAMFDTSYRADSGR